MNKTAKNYIETDDFEGAFERYEKARPQWKDHWFDVCATIYQKSKKWATKYFLDPIKRVIQRIEQQLRILFDCVDISAKDKNICYLIELLDADKKFLATKVGTTNRPILKRMNEILRTKKQKGVSFIRINRMYDCGNTPPEYYESLFRAEGIKLFPDKFVPNDCFWGAGAKFNLVQCDEKFAQWQRALVNG